MGEDILDRAWTLLIAPDWKEEKRLESTGDVVYSKVVKGKKLFKVHVSLASREENLFFFLETKACEVHCPRIFAQGTVDAPAKFLLEELFFGIETAPAWNPQLAECKTVQAVDSHTDVSYQVSAEAAGGVISTRDFVNLRHWGTRTGDDGETVYITSGASVKHPAMPPQPKRVR